VVHCLSSGLVRNFSRHLDSLKIWIIILKTPSIGGFSQKALKMVDQNCKSWVLGYCSWGFLTLDILDHHRKGGMNHDLEKNDRFSGMGLLDESI